MIDVLRNVTDRIRLLFRKERESYLHFYRMLGFFPRDISLYRQALLHKSTLVKSDKGRPLNNERLEFLGDAILDAVVADIVYRKFEGKREGFLTNTRSKIVQRETLNYLGTQIGLDRLIKHAARQFSHNSYMCGNAFEALVGAIYLDRGYHACMYFMEHRIIGPYINLEKISRKEVNFKSKLIEWNQKNHLKIDYKLISERHDKDSNPVFESEVLIEGVSIGRGTGYSKKESQQVASRTALSRIRKDRELVEQVLALKSAREAPQEEEIPMIPADNSSIMISLREMREQEQAKASEQIIREAEETAFETKN